MNPETSNSIIGGLTAIIVAIVGTFGGRSIIKGAKSRRLESTDEVQKDAIAQHAADPNAWVAAVTKDAADARADARAAREEATSARAEAANLRRAFDERDRLDRRKSVALIRWVTAIGRAWGNEDEMPYPDPEDRDILADLIPAAIEATRPRRPDYHKE